MEELIIGVAPYPSEHQDEKFPGRMDVAQEVIRCHDSGASVAHLHVRDEDGNQVTETRWFARDVGRIKESCAIIVTNANELVQDIHERMPVILSPESYDVWLDPSLGDRGRLQDLLKPYPANLMEAYPVGLAVNNPRNEGTELLERARA